MRICSRMVAGTLISIVVGCSGGDLPTAPEVTGVPAAPNTIAAPAAQSTGETIGEVPAPVGAEGAGAGGASSTGAL
jgi:hypothetical protein